MRAPCLVPLCWLLLGLSLSPARAEAPSSPLPPALQAFKDAWNRVAQAQPDMPDPTALKALPIYPYLQAARLQRDLGNPDPAQQSGSDRAVEAFLAAHAGEPVARSLTLAWLRDLAQRKAWPTFLAHYDAALADDALRCQWFDARIATGETQGLSDAVARAYQVPRSQLECDDAFDWLKQQGKLTPAMTVARAEDALRAGRAHFALELAAQLPDAQAAMLRRWATLVDDPEQGVRAAIAKPGEAVSDEALQDGWFRLSRHDPDTALTLYPQLLKARALSGKTAEPYTRALALGLAWDRRAEAVDYFRRFTPDADDTTSFEWRVRAALWSGDWSRVRHWIDAMPAALRNQPAWLYWRARAAAVAGNGTEAERRFASLVNTDGYYALLAAWRLHTGYVPQPTPVPDDATLRARLAQRPGVIRAHELFQVDLDSQANLEWQIALADTTPDERLQGIGLAMRWGWYLQGVSTASQQGVFDAYTLLYPTPYDDAVNAAAKRADLPRDWIYGVIRQESLYRADAQSGANAYGLMQLLLPTARRVARKHDVTPPADAQALFDPAMNVTLGADHLSDLIDWADGRLILALAAYNAGRHRAAHWLPDSAMAPDIWIENIPFDETRRYVQRILMHIAVFGWRDDGKPQAVAPLLPEVAPLPDDDADDDDS